MKKIMWLCNTPLQDVREELGVRVCSEGWLQGISDQLRRQEDIELHYVFPQKKSKKIFYRDIDKIHFWGFYSDSIDDYTLSSDREKCIGNVIKRIQPDIIHIFGTEFAHSRECMQAAPNEIKLIVSMQGLISELAKAYTKKLPIIKQIWDNDIWIQLLHNRYVFYKRGVNEKAVLGEVENVIGRTAWDMQCFKRWNPNGRYYYCNETMREPFYEGNWDISKIRRHSIYISQADYPIKGFHVFLEALAIVLRDFPDTCVYVAGNRSFLQSGNAYGKYVNKLMTKYRVRNRIRFLGILSAEEVKERMLEVHVTVMPSLLENSPNSIGEALLLGTPVVAAKVGGIPSLVRHEREALLYSGHSARRLSECIKRIFNSDDLAVKLSDAERHRAQKLYDRKENLQKLLKIYDIVMK